MKGSYLGPGWVLIVTGQVLLFAAKAPPGMSETTVAWIGLIVLCVGAVLATYPGVRR